MASGVGIKQPGSMPYGFIENKGQILNQYNQPNTAVLYLYSGNGLQVQLRKNAFSYEVIKTERTPRRDSLLFPSDPFSKFNRKAAEDITWYIHRVDVSFAGANPVSSIETFDQAPDYINYYTTGTPQEGGTFVHHYKKILYKNVYPRIDIEFLLEESGRFKYNFIVYPGGNPKDIQLKIEGAEHTYLTGNGGIFIETNCGDLEETIPETYTVRTQNHKQPVEAIFCSISKNVYGLSVKEFDPTQTLIIDPIVWCTYFGGNSIDGTAKLSIDMFGNIAMCGITSSISGIATTGAHQTTFAGGQRDVYIVKFNQQGGRLWSTYFGGSGNEDPYDLNSKNSTDFFICGLTSSTTGMATSGSHQGLDDAFVARFSGSGQRIWAVYLGGSQVDCAYGIVLDSNSNVYVTGSTQSTNGIATNGAFQPNHSGGPFIDAFLAKYSSSGSKLWATYYGSKKGEDYGLAIDTDNNQDVYIGGGTWSNDSNLSTPGTHQKAYTFLEDMFIAKFSDTGTRVWGTYYGGNQYDHCAELAVDADENVFISGSTSSTTGIASPGAYQPNKDQGNDAFLAKFNATGQRVWATYLGGESTDQINALSLNQFNDVFISGLTSSQTNLVTANAIRTSFGGYPNDALFAWFDSTGSLKMASYYGGSDNDFSSGIACGKNGVTYLLAGTSSGSGIATSGAFQTTLSGGQDAFLLKLSNCTHIFSASVNSPMCEGGNAFFTTPAIGAAGGCRYRWTGPNGYDTIAENPYIPRVVPAYEGTFRVIRYDSGSTCIDTAYVNLQVQPKPKAAFTVNDPVQCFNGNSFVFTDTSTITYGTYSRMWKLSNGDTSSALSFSRSFSVADTFLVKLTLISDKNCKDSFMQKLTVFPSVKTGFSFTNKSSCGIHQYLFTDTSSISKGGYQRLWQFSDGGTADTILVIKTYNASGTYKIKILTTSDSGCVDSAVKTLSLASPFAQPKAGFTQNSLALCLKGTPFVFTDTSSISGGGLSRQWMVSDSSFYNLDTLRKFFGLPGIYDVKLVVTSGNNCRDSVSKIITVFPQTNIGFIINHSMQCLQNNFIFTDTSQLSVGTYNRIWQLGDGGNSVLPIVNRSYAAGGYQVKLVTVTDKGCVDSLTKSISVLPFPKPEVGFLQNDLAQCLAGNGFILKDTSSISSGTLIRIWDFGDGSNSSNDSLIKTYLNAGTYQIRLLVTSNQNCTDSVKKYVTVHPHPKAGYTQNNTAQCLSGNLFLLSDTSTLASGTLTYSWDFGDNTFSANSNENKSFLSSGTYEVKLLVRSDQNCIDSVTKFFTVHPQTIIGFMLSSPANQCKSGNNFTLTDTSSVSSGTFTRLWLLGDGNSSSNPIVNKSFSNNGTYVIKLTTTTNRGCLDSVQKTVTVYSQPIARFSVNDSVQCFMEHDFLFTDSSIATSAYSRIWNLGDGNLNTNSVFHKKYMDTGTYVVQLKITDVNNCADSISKLMRLNQNPQEPHIRATNGTTITCTPAYAYHWFIDNTAVPNSNRQSILIYVNGTYLVKIDSSNGCSNTSYPLEVLFINDGAIKVYPNPNQGKFTVDFNTLQGDKTVKVIDVLGQEIARYYTPLNSLSINLNPEFAKGVYILEIHSAAGVLVKKIVSQ